MNHWKASNAFMLITRETVNLNQISIDARTSNIDRTPNRVIKENFDIESKDMIYKSNSRYQEYIKVLISMVNFNQEDVWMTLVRIKLIFCRCTWSIYCRRDMVISCILMKILVASFYGKSYRIIIYVDQYRHCMIKL